MLHLDEALWLRLSPLFDRALDLEPAARPELLESVRRQSPELATALERLLLDHDRALASRFLAEPLDDGGVPSLVGKELGPYTLVGLLGMGGMGSVWRARRSDGRFEKDVAVKLLNLAMLDRSGEERFRREGMLLARLDHPNIARLLDAGVSPAGQPYLVLELVEGTLLDVHADTNRLDVRARLELFAQAADAVAHAHANLVVHRDLKPSNILVDAGGRVKLLDFGVATLVDEASGQPVSLTLTQGRALTPAYAAPEQVQGGAVTTATDVYALGVLLYELLSGVHPTAASAATPASFARAVAEVEPARSSAAVAAMRLEAPETARLVAKRATTRDRLSRALRGDLDNILAKALRKRPADRYAAAAALAEDVRRFLRDEPVHARPESAWYRTRKFVTRHRLEAGAVASVALALAVGSIIALAQARTSARERDRALEELRRAEASNDLASYLLSEATLTGKPVDKAGLLARGEEMIERRFAGDRELQIHMLFTLSERYYENGEYEPWRRSVERAFAISRSSPDARLRALAQCWMAYVRSEFAEPEDASRLASEALAEFDRLAEGGVEEARCRVIESWIAWRTGDVERAISAGQRALALERGRNGPVGRERDALAALGAAYDYAGRASDSDRTYRELISLVESQGLGRTRNAANYLNLWSISLQQAGQYGQAVGISERTVALSRELDAEDGAAPSQLWTLANALSFVGRHQEAIGAIEEAVLKTRRAGLQTPLFWTLGTASRIYLEAGKIDSGDRALEELESIKAADRDPPLQMRAARDRVFAFRALLRGDASSASQVLRETFRQLEEANRPALERLRTALLLARSLNAEGKSAEAEIVGERALVVARERQSDFPFSHDVGAALLEIGMAQQGLNRPLDARASIEKAVEHLHNSSGDASPDTLRAVRLLAAGVS